MECKRSVLCEIKVTATTKTIKVEETKTEVAIVDWQEKKSGDDDDDDYIKI